MGGHTELSPVQVEIPEVSQGHGVVGIELNDPLEGGLRRVVVTLHHHVKGIAEMKERIIIF